MNGGDVTYGLIDVWLRQHRRLVVCTVISAHGSVPRRAGARMVLLPDGNLRGTIGGGLFESLARDEALLVMASGESRSKAFDFRPQGSSPDAFGAVCGGTVTVFFEVAALPEHLLIIGGGHCGRALARAATLLSRFRITLADAREFGNAEGDVVPGGVERVRLRDDYSDVAGRVDDTTYVALVSQGADTDERALRQVLTTPAPYIGMMGSRKKVRTVFDNLRRDGFAESLLKRVQAPIGLEIGAETPAEIAVSILAQIIAARIESRQAKETL